MALVDRLRGRLAYLDANVFIYAVEGIAPFAVPLAPVFAALQRSELRAVTSELSVAETLVKPIRAGDEQGQRLYQRTVRTRAGLTTIPVSRDVLVAAAGWRARRGFNLPDAIHVATAIAAGCDAFLTNDDRLKGLPIEVVRLADIA